MKKPVLVLILSSALSLQNGLIALLTSLSQVSAVLTAEDIDSACRLIKDHHPALIILDYTQDKLRKLIKKIKEASPHASLIVLVENVQQQRDASECSADHVLMAGYPADQLIEIIERVKT
jgi:DNA-binding NarL/FixJ family response regulator